MSQAILSLFGQDFQAGWSVLVILSLGNLINVGVGPVGYMLTMTGRPGLELLNSWLSGVLHIILNLLRIPRYGAIVAAVATAATAALSMSSGCFKCAVCIGARRFASAR